jgi:hypothetical protein
MDNVPCQGFILWRIALGGIDYIVIVMVSSLKERLISGSYLLARFTADFKLSDTIALGAPP